MPNKRLLNFVRQRSYGGIDIGSEGVSELVNPQSRGVLYSYPTNYEPRSYDLFTKPYNHKLGTLYYTPTLEKQIKGLSLDRQSTKKLPLYHIDIGSTSSSKLKGFMREERLGHFMRGEKRLNKSKTRKVLKEIRRRFPDIKKLELLVERDVYHPTDSSLDDTMFDKREIKLRRK